MINFRITKLAAAVIAVLALSACGSSSDEDSAVPDDPITDASIVDDAPVVEDSSDNGETGEAIINSDLSAGDVPFDSALADLPGSAFYAGSDNTAIVNGPIIGSSAVDNTMLVRSVPFEAESIPSSLQVEHVYMAGAELADERSRAIVIVRNISEAVQCNVRTDDMTVQGQDGEIFETSFGFTLVNGSRYSLGSFGLALTTCVAPGELVYLDDDFRIGLSDVQAVNVGTFEATEESEVDRSSFPLVPVSYDVMPDGSIEVMIVNQGSDPLTPSFSNTIILDSAGSDESRMLFNTLLMIVNMLVAIFLEKTTKKDSKNSSIPLAQIKSYAK